MKHSDAQCAATFGELTETGIATLAVTAGAVPDLDWDCGVDEDDVPASYASAPGVPCGSGCSRKDLDINGDVDSSDLPSCNAASAARMSLPIRRTRSG